MSEDASERPFDSVQVLLRFFADIPEARRHWLIFVCQVYLTGDGDPDPAAAERWLREFLSPARARHRFGRLLSLIAVLDFQIMPPAFERYRYEAERSAQSLDERLATLGRQQLQDLDDVLHPVVQKWQDLRIHELDEATLWLYRDGIEVQSKSEALSIFSSSVKDL